MIDIAGTTDAERGILGAHGLGSPAPLAVVEGEHVTIAVRLHASQGYIVEDIIAEAIRTALDRYLDRKAAERLPAALAAAQVDPDWHPPVVWGIPAEYLRRSRTRADWQWLGLDGLWRHTSRGVALDHDVRVRVAAGRVAHLWNGSDERARCALYVRNAEVLPEGDERSTCRACERAAAGGAS